MRLLGARAMEKLKQFPITLTEPISINSVSNSTNELRFHCQKANYLSKNTKAVRKLKKHLNKITCQKELNCFILNFLAAYL